MRMTSDRAVWLSCRIEVDLSKCSQKKIVYLLESIYKNLLSYICNHTDLNTQKGYIYIYIYQQSLKIDIYFAE